MARRSRDARRLVLGAAAPCWARSCENSILNLVMLILLIDFIFYWFHRAGHTINVFWAAHSPHHSAEEMNLGVGLRASITQRLFSFSFFWPLPILGFTPELIYTGVGLHLFGSFWHHTRLIPKLGWFEVWFMPLGWRPRGLPPKPEFDGLTVTEQVKYRSQPFPHTAIYITSQLLVGLVLMIVTTAALLLAGPVARSVSPGVYVAAITVWVVVSLAVLARVFASCRGVPAALR